MKPLGRGAFSVCPRPPSQQQSARPKSPPKIKRLPVAAAGSVAPTNGSAAPAAAATDRASASGSLSPAVRHILERQIIHDAASTHRTHLLEGDVTQRQSCLFGSKRFGRPPSSQAEPRPGSWRGGELDIRKKERRRDLERRAIEFERLGSIASGAYTASLSPEIRSLRSPKDSELETVTSRGWTTMRNSGSWRPFVKEGCLGSERVYIDGYEALGSGRVSPTPSPLRTAMRAQRLRRPTERTEETPDALKREWLEELMALRAAERASRAGLGAGLRSEDDADAIRRTEDEAAPPKGMSHDEYLLAIGAARSDDAELLAATQQPAAAAIRAAFRVAAATGAPSDPNSDMSSDDCGGCLERLRRWWWEPIPQW